MRRVAVLALAAVTMAAVVCVRPADAQSVGRVLAREDIILYGVGLRVEPAQQTVPKDIATIVSTFLQAPSQPDVQLPPFAPDADVRATLTGPSLAVPRELSVRPNTPFEIPPLSVPGRHTLSNIRLVSGGQVLLYGAPESVTIDVIERLLVTRLTARALSAEEIRSKGIVFDRSSFQAYNFSAAFAISDQRIQIDFPVVLPTLAEVRELPASPGIITPINAPALQRPTTIIPDMLKLQTRIPNLSVVGFQLSAPPIQGQEFLVPPIPGVIVIPGDIGFLNQFFSVMLMVANVAPGQSALVVTDLRATIVLPAGNDGVTGSGDDPLRMATTETGELPRERPIVQPGPDGRLGTADDIPALAPGESGSAEYLVEGRREGSHVIEMEIQATLNGLPVGPVPVRGRATGAVLVRNPNFTLTFTHPEIVTAGEAYRLDVTISNTSTSPANLVTLNLFPRNISGATLVGEPTRQVESIPAGDAVTVGFDLVSKVTGKVTAAALDADDQVAGRFAVKTAVGELGVPLSPDSLVLPKEAGSLPADLRNAALGLLGKAYAVATAPAAAMPPGLSRFYRKIVWDRAIELAQAGFRYSLHEPLRDSVLHLAMDFAGGDFSRLADLATTPTDLALARSDFTGFDELRRKSRRGDVMADAVAKILEPDLSSLGVSAFHRDVAQKVSYRPGHLSVLVGGASGPLPVTVALLDGQGRRLGGVDSSGKVTKEIPFGDDLSFHDAAGAAIAQLAAIASPVSGAFTVRLERLPDAPDDARFTLSLVLPDASGGLRHVVFERVGVADLPTLSFAPGDPYQVRFELVAGGGPVMGTPVAPSADQAIVDPPPSALGVVQQADADVLLLPGSGTPIEGGRVVAALFSEEVSPASAQDGLRPDEITHYAPEANKVVGVALQPGRRIVFLALRDPIGPFVPRQMTFSDVLDLRGQTMTTQTLPIETTVSDAAGVVSGQVLQADGTPLPFATVQLFYVSDCSERSATVAFEECGQRAGISSKSADEQGRFTWDYVSNLAIDQIVAIDHPSATSRDVKFRIARNGQRLNVNVVFLGRGMYRGTVLGEDGTIVPGARVTVRSLTDESWYNATTNNLGYFWIPGIPVGNILVEAIDARSGDRVSIADHIPFAGATVYRDLVVLTIARAGATREVGRLSGHVLRTDGATPAAAVPVMVYYKDASQAGVRCSLTFLGGECPIALGTTDAAGAFTFPAVTAGSLRVYAFDQTALQEGEARVVLAPEGTTDVTVLLSGGLATVRGIVLDHGGQRVAGASVGGGLSLTVTGADGEFVLTDVPVGRREIVAVSEALGSTGRATVDIVRAGEDVPVTVVLEAAGAVAGTVLGADATTPIAGIRVSLWKPMTGMEILVVAQATTDAAGRYRFDRVPPGNYSVSAFTADLGDGNVTQAALHFHNQVVRADITFRGGSGRVTGVVYGDDGQTPLRARVSVSGDQLVVAGGRVGVRFEYVQHFRVVDTDPATGRFTLDGLWVGPFTLRAAGQFSPDPISVEGRMPAAGATVAMDLRLQPTSQVAGTITQPDGVTPVGANVVVRFKSDAFKIVCTADNCVAVPQGIQEESVVTNDRGEYWFPVVNAGTFTLTAEDQASGRTARVHGAVRAGERAELGIRLLGRGELTVQVLASDAVTPIPGARVEVVQLDPPNRTLTFFADANGIATFGGGDAFGEGQLVVSATDVRNGFAGRASAKIAVDGERVTVRVFLFNATGTVAGTVWRSDGLTPAPNAEVVVSQAGRALAFAVSDAAGRYRQEQIPLGEVTVEVFDPVTAGRGSRTARIDFDRQEVPVDVTEEGLGVVTGVLLENETLAPLKGWFVWLSQESTASGHGFHLATTSGVDGAFYFPGVPIGSFRVLAAPPRGTAQDVTFRIANMNLPVAGTLTRDGQIVELTVIVNGIRLPTGRIEGTVRNPDGSPAAASQVDVCRTVPAMGCNAVGTVTAAPDGTFFLDEVPLGRYTVVARSQVTRDVGSGIAELAFQGNATVLAITLVGLSRVTGAVQFADGRVAPWVEVTLDGRPATGCGGRCTGFADADGRFSFVDVPARTYTVAARDPLTGLRGAVGGTLTPGDNDIGRLVLQPAAGVRGRVLFSNGSPAPAIVGELRVAGAAPLFVETDGDGLVVYDTVPFGAFTLTLQDPVGPGVATRTGTITGEVLLGDVVLDENPPGVVSTVPSASAASVPTSQAIRIVFSEPLDLRTVNSTSITLSSQTTQVPGVITTSDTDTIVTFTPLSPLADETRYTLRVRAVADRIGKTMSADFVASFTTVDVTPARAIEISPPPGATGVAIDSPVRIKYSEPFDPSAIRGPPVTVSAATGTAEGRVDYLFGNTVLVFTPLRPLADDMVYRVQVAPVTDLAGNVQPQGLDYQFGTTDRTPPQVVSLNADNGGVVIENGNARVTADVGSADVAFVDFFVNDVLVSAARSRPFALTFQATASLGRPGDRIKVSAVATDTSGNRGLALATFVTIAADQPPTATITSPANGFSARNGDRVPVVVAASDDLGITQIGFRAQTGNARDAATRVVAPPTTGRAESFDFQVPPEAIPGSTIRVEASAVDSKGQIAQAAPIEVLVLDAVAPSVTITGLTTGAQVRPGQQATAVVAADDGGGVASIIFSASGAASVSETRAIEPARNSVATSFTFSVSPAALPTDRVALDAIAVDAAGNRTSAARVLLPVADLQAPTVRLRTPSGSTTMVPGRPVTVVAEADDEIGVARIEVSGFGAFTYSNALGVSPPLATAIVSLAIPVPAGVLPGAVLTLQAVATDIFGNASAPVSLALTATSISDVVLPPSLLVVAGETVQVPVALPIAAPAGGTTVTFASTDPRIATVAPSVTVAEGQTSASISVSAASGGIVTIDAFIGGVQRASTIVTVRGGVVSGTVFDSSFNPVAGAQVTVTSGIGFPPHTAVTDAAGRYFVEGVGASWVTAIRVKAIDPQTQLIGVADGSLSGVNGFAHLNVVLVPAGAIQGVVLLQDGQTRSGAGVRVDLFDSGNPPNLVGTSFTADDGTYEFPLVSIGTYLLEAASADGHRGRAEATIAASGQLRDVPVTYLGLGTVTGTVLDGLSPVPNAEVTLRARSIFGYAPAVVVNALPDGSFRLDNVFVGTFTLYARDPVSRHSGQVAGTVTSHLEVVTRDVTVAPSATLEGTVFRSDGVTPIGAGALVAFQAYGVGGVIQTYTDENGRYVLPFLPLRQFSVRVDDAATRAIGYAAGSLTVSDETRQLDIVLFGQGAIVATVTDAAGTPVAGAAVDVTVIRAVVIQDRLSGISASDGTVVFERLLAGSFTITARTASGVAGTATGTLGDGEVRHVAVRIEPTATITGTVYAPDGQTPLGDGRIVTFEATSGGGRETTAAADGRFRYDGLPLGSYTILAYDTTNRLRAIAKDVILTADGQVETRNLTFVGLGTVRGRVLNPDTSSAPNLVVNVQSHAPDVGGFLSATTNAAGFYEVIAVPVGAVSVATGDLSRSLLGEGSGNITRDGEILTIDILLVNNAIALPTTRLDANGSQYPVQVDGSLRGGDGSVYSNGSYLGAALLDLTVDGAMTRFTGAAFGTLEDRQQEVVVRQQGVAGLDVTRKIFVAETGYFARYLEILTNPTAAPITVDLRLTSYLGGSYGYRLVSSSAAPLSLVDVSGAENPDRWAVLDDNSGSDGDDYSSNPPAVAFVFDGPGALDRLDSASYVTSTWVAGQLVYEWRSVIVPPGASVVYMHFTAQQPRRASALASAVRLIQLPPEALAGLSASEIGAILNFAVPADGVGPLATLPALTGTVSGRVLEWDNLTPVPWSTVTFTSQNILFGRSRRLQLDSTAAFSFVGSVANRTPVPLDGFWLGATYDWSTNRPSPIVAASFAPGETSVVRNIVFSDYGTVSGRVWQPTGLPATSGTVTVSRTSPSFSASGTIESDGRYVIPGIPAGTFTLRTDVRSAQGGVLGQIGILVTVAAGQATTADLTLPALATVRATVLRGDGSPYAGARVYATDSVRSSSVSATADASGVASFPNMAEGTVGVWATQGVSPFAFAGSQAALVARADDGQTIPVTISAPTGGTVRGTVFAADGQTPVRYVSVEIRDAVSGRWLASPSVSALGVYQATGIAAGGGGVTVIGTYSTSTIRRTAVFTTPGETLTVDLILPLSVVRGTVYFADQITPVPNPDVFVTQTDGAGVTRTSYSSSSDASGNFVVLGVGTGEFSLVAQAPGSGLTATVAGALADVGTAVTVDAVLPPSGTVTGTVFLATGAVAPSGTAVALRSAGLLIDRTGSTVYGGTYRFERVGLGPFFVQACRGTPQVCATASGALDSDGQTATINITLPATGTVTGTVWQADGVTPMASASVTVENSAGVGPLGSYKSASASANAAGVYTVNGVPVGAIRVSAKYGSAMGIAEGTLTSMQPATVDVTAGNALWQGSLPLDGADGFRYGADAAGGYVTLYGPTDGRLEAVGASSLWDKNGWTTFTGGPGLIASDGRGMTVGPMRMNGLTVTRQVFVPPTGGFARILEVFANPTSVPVIATFDVREVGGSPYSCSAGIVVDPSTTGNTYGISDQRSFSSCLQTQPLLGWVFAGPDAPLPPSAVQFATGQTIFHRWNVTVPANQTVIVMHFAVQRDLGDVWSVRTQAEALVNLTDATALAGMSEQEKAAVVNFRIR